MKINLKNVFYSLVLVLLLPIPIFSQAPLVLGNFMEGKTVWQNSLILEDTSANFTKEEIISGKRDSEFSKLLSPNLGFSSSQFWIRLPVQNPSTVPIEWMLEYNFPLIDEIEIYGNDLPEGIYHLTGDSFPFSERNEDYRNPVFPLVEKPKSQSVYYIRIKSGSTIPISLEAWSTKELISKMTKEQILFGLFYGIILVMAIYNFSIFVFTRDYSYLYYVFFITSISLFHLSNNGFAFQYLWPDWIWWANYCLPFFICSSCFTGITFATNFLSLKKHAPLFAKLLTYWFGILVAVSIVIFFLPYRIAVLTSIGFAVPAAIIMIVSGIIAILKKSRTARFYLIAWTFFLFGCVLYSLKSLGILPDNHITRWMIQIGTAVELVLLSLGLADRINSLSRSLRENIRELSGTKIKIEESEKRFKEIFQGSEEVIFMLNESGEILNANRSLSRHLGFRLDDVRGKKITHLLYSTKKKAGFNELYVNDKFEELVKTGKVVHFQTEFAQKYVKEPKDMKCSIQFVELDDTREILVKLSPQYEDSLSKLVVSERIEFSMNNYLRNAELISQKITSQLAQHMNSVEQTEVRTAVREILINAIEHGNLNIGFEEKSNALIEGNYLEFLQKRQEDARYNRKKVYISYILNEEYVAYRILDEGKGFDHQKVFSKTMEELNEALEQHGRGILMTRSVFDRVEYNDAGNQVSLIKYLRKPASAAAP
ncbi:7TM diverse intracellular signaling domain-containing protein [Leptospira sp. 'Mane']|uniref:7TM diverse intracellular signaling domain-containing protein n=1 Tax=Leptospira sp. 'Mane' TaxID=3387407 RepID=UPI00398B0934